MITDLLISYTEFSAFAAVVNPGGDNGFVSISMNISYLLYAMLITLLC